MEKKKKNIEMAGMGNPEQYVTSRDNYHCYSSSGGKGDVRRQVVGFCDIVFNDDLPASFSGHNIEFSPSAEEKLGKTMVETLELIVKYHNIILEIRKSKTTPREI